MSDEQKIEELTNERLKVRVAELEEQLSATQEQLQLTQYELVNNKLRELDVRIELEAATKMLGQVYREEGALSNLQSSPNLPESSSPSPG